MSTAPVVRPLMDASREELRAYVEERERSGKPVACDAEGGLWREDATNAHTDRFRAYVRHEIVPRAKERNPQLLDVLGRTMNLIADEDDFMESLAEDVAERCVAWLAGDGAQGTDFGAGFVLAPSFGMEPLPLRRRVCLRALQSMLGPDARVETASVEAVLAAFSGGTEEGSGEEGAPAAGPATAGGEPAGARGVARAGKAAAGKPLGGYVANIQGDLAVSANKHGVRVEPMAAFRARRKRA